MLFSIGISIDIYFLYTHILFSIYVCFINFHWYFLFIHIYDLFVLELQDIYIIKAQSMFMLSLIQILISISISIGILISLCIIFNWYFYQNLQYTSIGINMFQLQLKFKIYVQNLYYLVTIGFLKNVLIYIAYMQGELNISSTYRFMLSVSYNEEVDNSSLCDTRV